MFKSAKRKVIPLTLSGIFAIILILAWPVYETLAHKSKLPFLPFYRFIALPAESPSQQMLYNKAYRETGEQLLDVLTRHKLSINAPAISAAVATAQSVTWVSSLSFINAEN